MSDDTSVGTYVHIGHNSGTYYNLEKNALKFGRSLDNTHFQIIENKGMDIGGKICCLNYLYEINYMFDYILFIHSKNDSEKRSKYV